MGQLARVVGLFAVAVALAACGGAGGGGEPVAPPGPDTPVPPPPPPSPPVPDEPGKEPDDPDDGSDDMPIETAMAQLPQDAGPARPIMFVTQVRVTGSDFGKITGTFGNHQAHRTPKGGDLMIAYPPATPGQPAVLRNLTREAGFGMQPDGKPTTSEKCVPSQGRANLVAVREPSISWDGKEALVSITTGCGNSQRWQIYRVTNILQGSGTAEFTPVPNQPANYNNVSPIYSSHATPRIFFTSDMPRGGPGAQFSHLKCIDEYEMFASICGMWELDPDPANAKPLSLVHHTPSGMFNPTIDSAGRVIFSQWDHLDDDQQEHSEKRSDLWNFVDEGVDATKRRFTDPANTVKSVFPEFNPSRSAGGEDGHGTHVMKVFLPWQINQDGTGTETLNHFGRHEFFAYAAPSRTSSNLGLEELPGTEGAGTVFANAGIRPESARFLREDPLKPQTFYMIIGREFGAHGGGCIVTMKGSPALTPSSMDVELVTHKRTCDSGGEALYRSPLPTTAGELWATVSRVTNSSESSSKAWYDYRLVRMKKQDAYFKPSPGGALTPGLTRVVDGKMKYLWEFDAVEVVARNKPAPATMEPVPEDGPEHRAFETADVTLTELQDFMRQNELALIVSRNVTQRNRGDRQQPFNLQVRDGGVKGIADDLEQFANDPSKLDVMNISHLQLFSAQQLRTQTFSSVQEGANNKDVRRVLAQPWKPLALPNGKPVNPPMPSGLPEGSVKISADGSVAAFVPAKRAMTWQLIDSANPGNPELRTDGIVRERVWVDFQPGEVRVCTVCHGGGPEDQLQTARVENGQKVVNRIKDIKNTPAALVELLNYYKDNLRGGN